MIVHFLDDREERLGRDLVDMLGRDRTPRKFVS